jgi:DNA-binding PadR family transcriptional regulator
MGKSPSYTALLILASLADADRHGYAIKKDIAERSGGEVRLGSTTLYRLLGQLLDAGLIEEAHSRPAPQLDDERRRYFHITTAGRRELVAEARRLERVLLAVRPALAPRGRA